MSRIVFLNGKYVRHDRARIPVDDRGFLFGDGVYEVIRALDGELFQWESHLRRLEEGLSGLQMRPRVLEEADALFEVARALLARNDLVEDHAIVYLQVTRGVAPRTHHFPPPGTAPTVYVSATPFAPPSTATADGVAAVTWSDLRWGRCDLKTVNLLPNVLAKQHAVAAGATESVLVRDGLVTEGSHSNLFAVIGGTLRTHPASPRILAGITRQIVLRLASEAGVPVDEVPISVDELRRADEIFLTGTTTDVMPIRQLDDRPVGTGRPGRVTRRFQNAYAAEMARSSVSAKCVVV